jgi:site-specific recombinase XerD
MNLHEAIDAFVNDMWAEGRFRSAASERSYRGTLYRHAEDVLNRDPRYVGRDDVKITLSRWKNPSTRSTNRSHLLSFYDWVVSEGLRRDNPARATRPSRREPKPRRRLNQAEAWAMLGAAQTIRERRAIYLGICAGLRRGELLGLQGRHFSRDSYVWVSADIGKGKRERYVPIIRDLEPVVAEIRAHVALDEYVLCAQRWRDPGQNKAQIDLRLQPASPQALWRLVDDVAQRAGIVGHVSPHAMRHAFADYIAKSTDTHTAQHLLGHKDIATTQIYLANPLPDELAAAVKHLSFGAVRRTNVLGVAEALRKALEATTGIEPV